MPESLLKLLSEHKIGVKPAFNVGFIREGGQWFTGFEEIHDGQTYRVAFFGDFARSLSLTWEGSSESMTPDQKKRFSDFKARAQAENQKERETFWKLAQAEVEKEWATFSTLGESPYLHKKGFDQLFGCRLEAHEMGARTIVPAYDISNTLWGYQRIFSEKLDIGDKVFRKGARKEGCFHVLGKVHPGSGEVYLCEGIATAASVYLALDKEFPVLACFDAGNLLHVAKAIRAAFPQLRITFAADNDQYPARDGKVYHTGAKKSEAAARVTAPSSVVVAQFDPKDLGARPTDFNDMHVLYGLERVKACLLGTGAAKGGADVAKSERLTPGQIETMLVDRLLMECSDQAGPVVVRQGKDFFRYERTHWVHMDPLTAPDYFRARIDELSMGKLKYKDIQSAYAKWYLHVAKVPHGINLFAPNPLAQNFRNGTLHLLPMSDGTFELQMRPHKRDDYLIHCHGFDYREGAPRNEEFEATLDRIWKGDPDIQSKKDAYFEVLGACLVPAFRKLVIFRGKPKSGKTTLVLFATHMVHQDYLCSVDPSQFSGFNLESMAGKLVNYDTDINLTRSLDDSVLKKIEDRVPMRIRRKGISDIYAPLPGMHLFAANRMPVSSEGGQAYDRRLLVFSCESYQPSGDSYVLDFAQHVWRQGAEGIVSRAIEGLKRLAASGGHFTIPESSRAEIAEWKETQGDLVQDFITDTKDGGFVDQQTKVYWGEDLKMERHVLYEAFKEWAEKSAPRAMLPGKIKFYGRLKQLGIAMQTVKGVRYFHGFGSEASGGSSV